MINAPVALAATETYTASVPSTQTAWTETVSDAAGLAAFTDTGTCDLDVAATSDNMVTSTLFPSR